MSTNRMITKTTLRRVMHGAIFFGLFAAGMIALQGLTIAKTYTTIAAREEFAATLTSVPQLGVIYGEPINLATPAGYMIYRSVGVVALIGAMWGLFAMTKFLRGQEEDGQWEVLLSGQTTARQAIYRTLLGGGLGILVAYVVASILVILTGHSSEIGLSPSKCLLLSAALVLPAACFMSVGALTSQLAATRRRAILYGIVPLVVLFFLRSIGNVVSSLEWLKYLTPFGWLDKLHIVANAQPLWLLPFVPVAACCIFLAVRLADRRDLGESMVAESGIAKSHLGLLGHPWEFSFRLMRPGMLGWLLGSVLLVSLMTSLSKTAAKAVDDSHALTKALSSLSGSAEQSIGLAFIGFGILLLAIILMVMMTTGLTAIRNEESKGYLDNLLAQPISRIRWLSGRLALLGLAAGIICAVCGFVVWQIALHQGQHLTLETMATGSLSLLGPVFLLLGIGMLAYSVKPRIAAPLMYLLLGWSLVIDLLDSSIAVPRVLIDTSLFHYVALVPAASPDWSMVWLTGLAGIGLIGVGIAVFSHRDLEAE